MLATKTKSKLDIKSNWDKNLNTPKNDFTELTTFLATGQEQRTCPASACDTCK